MDRIFPGFYSLWPEKGGGKTDGQQSKQKNFHPDNVLKIERLIVIDRLISKACIKSTKPNNPSTSIDSCVIAKIPPHAAMAMILPRS